jgi:hypothetical protein
LKLDWLIALDGALLLLDVSAVDLMEKESKAKCDDIRKFVLDLLVIYLIRLILYRVAAKSLTQDHDISHEVFEFL